MPEVGRPPARVEHVEFFPRPAQAGIVATFLRDGERSSARQEGESVGVAKAAGLDRQVVAGGGEADDGAASRAVGGPLSVWLPTPR